MKLCFWNNELICSTETPYDIGLPGHQWLDAPLDYEKDKHYKLEDGQIIETQVSEYDPSRLRVHRVLPLGMNPLISDFTILGFKKVAPYYDRGRKVNATYMCAEKDEIIVQKIFTDIRDTTTGRLTDLQVLFNWYAEDGTVGLSKTEIVKSFNKAQSETEERNRRERALDFLISEGKDTQIEPIMDALFYHFHDQQALYKEKGSPNFADAINTETDPTLSAYLAIRVPVASNNAYTIPIKEAILYQIRAIDEAQFNAALLPAGV